MSRRRGERSPAAVLLALGALLVGFEAPDRVLDLAAPRPFPIEGDVPIPPPPPPPPPAPPPSETAAETAAPPAVAVPPPAVAVPPPPAEAAGPSAAPPPGLPPRAMQSGPTPSPSPAGAVAGTAPASPGAPSFTVQVGAFRRLEQAQALAARLAARGYDTFVLTVDLAAAGGQGVWHRVRVGHFAERHLAAALAGRLADEERVPAQVLREGPVVR